MRTYILNNQSPSIKEGEFNSSTIGIIVPEDMRSYNLFLVFMLPSGEKVFTPSILLDQKSMVTYPLPAAVLSETGRVQVELQGFEATSYIKSVTYSFTVVKSLTGPTNGTGSELKKEDYLPWYTEAAGFKEEVEAIAGEYKLAEAQRVSKEIGRVAGESARVIAENNRVVNENQRINDFSGKADKATTYTKTEVDTKDGLKADKLSTYTKTENDTAMALKADKAETYTKTEIGLLSGLLTTAKTSIVNAINELFNGKANKAQEAWITPTLLNGWSSFAGAPVQFMKDQFGFVHLKGVLTTGTKAQRSFTLPVGYRPGKVVLFISNSGYDDYTTGYIATDGGFTVNKSAVTDIGIEHITFKAV